MMTGAEFITKVGAMGSDHGLQGLEIRQGSITLRGFTHNTLNRMHDKDHCPSTNSKYSNNPANHQETEEEYLVRKYHQLNYYLDKIANKELDYHFAFLQEVDLFFSQESASVALCENFKRRLGELGWGVIQTPNLRTCKPMVTLYDQRLFEFRKCRGVFKDKPSRKDTTLESIFVHKPTGQNITLTNLHLDYNKEGSVYSSEITKYLSDKTAAGHLSILGGDTNHPRQQLVGALGSTEFATSFDADEDTGELSLQYRLDKTMMSAIDSFFVSPSADNVVSVKPMDCTIFTDTFNLRLLPAEYNQMRISLPGALVLDYHSAPIVSSSSSYTPGYSAVFESSRAQASSSTSASSRSSNADLLQAAIAITPAFGKNKQPKISYDRDHFIIALYYDNDVDRKQANKTLSTLSTALYTNVGIRRAPTRDIRKEIEGDIIKGKKYRLIRLTDDEAAALVRHHKMARRPIRTI